MVHPPLKWKKKRPFILIEVLLAMMLILIALSPLLTPHIQLAQMQNRFVQEIEYHHFANLLFSDIYEKLHGNKISLDAIRNQELIEVDPRSVPGWEKELYGHQVHYHFSIMRQKGDENARAYLVTLHIVLSPQNPQDKKLNYQYGVFLYQIGGLTDAAA